MDILLGKVKKSNDTYPVTCEVLSPLWKYVVVKRHPELRAILQITMHQVRQKVAEDVHHVAHRHQEACGIHPQPRFLERRWLEWWPRARQRGLVRSDHEGWLAIEVARDMRGVQEVARDSCLIAGRSTTLAHVDVIRSY